MRAKFIKVILTTTLALATALTISCSSGDDNDNGSNYSSSSKWNSSSSSLDIEKSSSSQNADVSSSSSVYSSSSSSSGQDGSDCISLNSNMAVTMNLNGEPVVVTKNGSVLIEGINYEVITPQNPVKVNGLHDYIGSVKRTNSGSNSGIVVKDGNKILTENTDYIIVETDNSVKIVGINDYIGSVEVVLKCEPKPAEGLIYYGVSYTEELYGPAEELDMIIGNGMLKSSEATTETRTLNFKGTGFLCILIPSTLGQITSLKDALNTENLGDPEEPGRSIFRRGQITYNGISYYLYTGNNFVGNWNINFVMSFQ